MRKVFLSVSGLALTACSMSGGGYADQHHSSQFGHSSYAVKQNCTVVPVFNRCGYVPPKVVTPPPVAPKPCYTPNPCAPTHGHYKAASYKGGYAYPVSHTPSAHSYGTQTTAYQGGYGSHGLRSGVWNGPHAYGSLGGIMYDVDEEAFGVQARLGYQFHPILAAEVEGSIGIKDDESTVGASTVNVGVNHSVGGFALARLPVSDSLGAFARIGYHASEIGVKTETGAVTTTDSESVDGLAYGGGVELSVSETDSIRADYTRYETEFGTADSISLGYQRRF